MPSNRVATGKCFTAVLTGSTNRRVGAPIDANGNLTADGTRTFEWDARNQLVAVIVAAHRSEFTCDGFQRRARTVEKEYGVVQRP